MTTLTFQNTTLSVIDQNNQKWMPALEVGRALGYSNPSVSISQLYDRNKDEFTSSMTAIIDMDTTSGIQKVRIFSLRGCWLLGMRSHTKVAKDFRKWVLDILDREILQNEQQNQPLVKPEVRYPASFTGAEIYSLVWLLISHRNMNDLLGELEQPLAAIGSNFHPAVYSHHREYKRLIDENLPILKRLIEPFKESNPIEFERIKSRLKLN
ncbi:P22AR C-terminal domain-containing protein [Glaesserella parasuis]|uniref:P22AR C-terminal domain-containing protein n=2 Tax=Glaesserella parasuis TaxID=738 RepID=UPI0013135681|nr:P22AR C-terminal domain-containing protein [Glaesserella parasuis]MDG6260122.1 P22AR C-terminal domain-containing protein [Glaesserella parasuis]MDG6266477.1 P22AR C-terminal domain-containing protein [Glaesserella parasuis]MDG6270699.1 P22AR C-terminal domain-containing protein [Glaesserella parasuis]MDG6429377.1 P22AR C-terminal domain-containing protein [Glaesserella parasuis]MDO9677059.1 P22AR C-terminal domain-containing protein [Glaesserella parasuis]